MKKDFILYDIMMLTVGASFQRAKVYKPDTIESDKIDFRNHLKDYIIKLSDSYSERTFSENEHIKNIYSIITFSKVYGNILNNGHLNFGVSQKLLNLYLKYLWCLDFLKITPPHFPVDRIIQMKLSITNPYPWTQMNDEKEYLKIIRIAENILNKYNAQSVAELELKLYQRR